MQANRIPRVGDRAPLFVASTGAHPAFSFGSNGGCWQVLLFFNSLADAEGHAALRTLKARRGLFDDADTRCFGVSTDPADRAERGLRPWLPGVRHFQDYDLAVSTLYGLAGENGQRTMAFLLDRAFRIVAVEPLPRLDALLDALEANLADEADSVLMAPVLTVPRVFEPELCAALIDYHHAEERPQSGVMREVDGVTVGVRDPKFKSRRDARVTDPELQKLAEARIVQRLIPQIRLAFNWQATRVERFMVACYDAQEGGHFSPHRDNTTSATAHRVFAVSVNLNGGYEGGDLVFPEYGRRTYRPPPGGATVFSCSLLHAATPVTKGVRYVFVPFLYDEAGFVIRQANMGKRAPRPGEA